jgi:hypothetical protein
MAMGYSARQKLTDILILVGADTTPHSGRSLLHHLIGTYDLLKEWGCAEQICVAGGLHSVYGTNVFRKQSLNESARGAIRNLLGSEAEELAWLFGCLNRPRAIEDGIGFDRRGNSKIVINDLILPKLRLMEAANLIEQGARLDGWPKIMRCLIEQCRSQSESIPTFNNDI